MVFFPKSNNEPLCLSLEKAKKSGTYNCQGVAEALKNDFHNKCYICETKEPQSINIEHFIPHKGDRDLMFDWQNLFYCCTHCNNTKLGNFDNILNCTQREEEVETKIKYKINPFPGELPVISALVEDEKVHNTVHLLQNVYLGNTEQKRIESGNIRSKLLSEIRIFQELLIRYFDERYEEDERGDFRRNILWHLKTSSNFTAFKRWIIRENDFLFTEFGQYLI